MITDIYLNIHTYIYIFWTTNVLVSIAGPRGVILAFALLNNQ